MQTVSEAIHSIPIFQPVVSATNDIMRARVLIPPLCLLLIGGCFPIIPPPGMVVAAPPANLEDPDKYRVDPAKYSTFHVKEKVGPPPWKSGTIETKYPMASIEPTDIWKVTHIVAATYLIYSEIYNDRQCKLLAQLEPSGIAGAHGKSKCYVDYLYHVAINSDGTVRGGWKLLKNPERFRFARDRYRNMQIDPVTPDGWGPQPLFVPGR